MTPLHIKNFVWKDLRRQRLLHSARILEKRFIPGEKEKIRASAHSVTKRWREICPEEYLENPPPAWREKEFQLLLEEFYKDCEERS